MRTIKKKRFNKHFKPEEMTGICVVRRDDESNEDLIKRFRKKFSKSGLTKELRERMFYEKPSDKKRRKRLEAERARIREEEKQEKAKVRFRKLKQQKEKRDDTSSRRQDRRRTNEERYNEGRNYNSRSGRG